ncbi:adenine phosphoribosyltransferase [Oratosquilla oratoria]|uniref:adenine phosphoribosyltransferase n=1 Tax=Oratosquilla oratoria TaxID=337810 RepID=UPI003F75D733
MADSRIVALQNKIKKYPDFPKKGVLFWDIFSLLHNPADFEVLIDVLLDVVKAKCPDVDVIVGLESRGFLFGTPLALKLKKPFIPIRKKGKLPGEVKQVSFVKEYGEDIFEMQSNSVKPGEKVLIVDDLLATGGTLKSACELVETAGGHVILCLLCIELTALKGREKIQYPCESLMMA